MSFSVTTDGGKALLAALIAAPLAPPASNCGSVDLETVAWRAAPRRSLRLKPPHERRQDIETIQTG
jgi:hypothetical protein